jgi:hypothetical protein
MDWQGLGKRLLRAHTSMSRFALPAALYEIEPEFVIAARLEGSGRQARRVRHVGIAPLAPHALEPHLARANVANGDELRRALGTVTPVVGNVGGYGLILPDGAARVGILTFETLPEAMGEAEALIRWRMREKLPYPPDEARLSFQVLVREPGHVEVLAVAARSSVLREYESAVNSGNGSAGLILPATLTLLPLLPSNDNRGHLLLHVCARWVTAVVVSGGRPCIWRTRELNDGTDADVAREVAAEAVRVLASARDRLQSDLGRTWLCARPPAGKEMAGALSEATAQEVEVLKPRVELAATLTGEERILYEQFGAPVAGLVSNAASTS